jgi:hypothetical protein
MLNIKQAVGIGLFLGPLALGSAYIIGKYNPYSAYVAKLNQLVEYSQMSDYEKAQLANENYSSRSKKQGQTQSKNYDKNPYAHLLSLDIYMNTDLPHNTNKTINNQKITYTSTPIESTATIAYSLNHAQ